MILQQKAISVQRILFLAVQQAEEKANVDVPDADRDSAGVN